MTLNIAFNYGGRAEIVDAVRGSSPTASPRARSTRRRCAARLYHPEMPDPDLVVRTSGEYRISNFLLWEMAYSELVFTDVLWPDFRREDLFDAIVEYQRRERRFGGSTSERAPRRSLVAALALVYALLWAIAADGATGLVAPARRARGAGAARLARPAARALPRDRPAHRPKFDRRATTSRAT